MAPSLPSPVPTKTIYCGRFISAPNPGPDAKLEIREGAVLVVREAPSSKVSMKGNEGEKRPSISALSRDQGQHEDGDGAGVDGKGGRAEKDSGPASLVGLEGWIEKVDWTVDSPEAAREKFGVGVEEADVVSCGRDGFFFPGFVDTHIHASQYPNAGIFGQSTLLDWLEIYTFPLEASLGNAESPMYTRSQSQSQHQPPSSFPIDPLTRAKQVYNRVIKRTLASGTTTAAYYATIYVPATNALADLAFTLGQRAFIGRVCMDEARTCPKYYRDESTEASLANSRACIAHCRDLDPEGKRVLPILTPRFAPSCRLETLKALGGLAAEEGNRQLRIQTHISENTKEVELVAEMFPDSKSYAAVYDDTGLLTERMILAHAVHLSAEERKLVSSRKAKVSHCPASNSALGSGYCPVRTLLEDGIEVGLGTDVSGGFSVSILEAVRQAYLVSRTVAFHQGQDGRFNVGMVEGLHLATVGGAKVVGMGASIGKFEVGMNWDVQEIELTGIGEDGNEVGLQSAVDVFGWETWEEKVAKWVWNGDERNVKRVWVGGRLVSERR